MAIFNINVEKEYREKISSLFLKLLSYYNDPTEEVIRRYGLCHAIGVLYENEIINLTERCMMGEVILHNRPSTVMVRDLEKGHLLVVPINETTKSQTVLGSSGYGWTPGEIIPRVLFIEKIIENCN